MTKKTCPLCHSAQQMDRPKLLYDTEVCRTCYNGFARRRRAAYIIDDICYAIIALLLLLALKAACTIAGTSFTTASWLQLILEIPLALVFALKDGFAGHSPGKKLFGVQVVDRTTLDPISFTRSFKRNWLLVIPYISGVLVLITAFNLGPGPRIGDGLAKTKVIWKKYRHTKVFSPDQPYCEQCGYDLRGNISGVCPECGQPTSETNQRLISAIGATPPVATVGT